MAVSPTLINWVLLLLLVIHYFGFVVVDSGRIKSFCPQDFESSDGPPEMSFLPQYFADGYLDKVCIRKIDLLVELKTEGNEVQHQDHSEWIKVLS